MNRGSGFFNMDFINQVAVMTDLNEAKKACADEVKKTEGARPENTRKAYAMISNASTIRSLLIGLGNFLLAHEDPANKAIRTGRRRAA